MGLYKRRNSVFDRIGDRYGTFIDPDHFLGRNAFEEGWMTSPAMNVSTTADHYDLEIALPGYSKDNISVTVNNRILEISAEKEDINEDVENVEYITKEIDTRQIKRTFQLSSDIDTDKIESAFENGLLSVRLPLSKGTESAKTIKVA